jgi:hypothetical protein
VPLSFFPKGLALDSRREVRAAKLTKLPMLPIGNLMRPMQLFNPDRERIDAKPEITKIPAIFGITSG